MMKPIVAFCNFSNALNKHPIPLLCSVYTHGKQRIEFDAFVVRYVILCYVAI